MSAAAVAMEPQSGIAHDVCDDERENNGQTEISIHETPAQVTDDGDLQTFDPTQFDFDLDIFEYFDPDFDISAIDAAFADPHDPSLPIDVGHLNPLGG